MNDDARAQRRIDALETRIAHQDQTIEDLNRVVNAQWKRIDGLARQIAHLAERLKEALPAARQDPARGAPFE
jgi:SlyX protein